MVAFNLSSLRAVSGIALLLAAQISAQAQSSEGPAYLVVELEVTDQQGFQEYAEKATKTVSDFGGSFVVLAREARAIEGADPEGVVTIIRFDSLADAQRWLESPEYSAVKPIRHATANTRQYLVEGVSER
jgi:uncharacterized protein (DUF1330 family)